MCADPKFTEALASSRSCTYAAVVAALLLSKETVVCGLGYDTPRETVTAYREALGLRPFMDDGFRSEVQEVRQEGNDISGGRGSAPSRECLQKKWLSVFMCVSKGACFRMRIELDLNTISHSSDVDPSPGNNFRRTRLYTFPRCYRFRSLWYRNVGTKP